MAEGPHLFPFRTEKLSPHAPMVLRVQARGRVGCRRDKLRRPGSLPRPSSFLRGRAVMPQSSVSNVAHVIQIAVAPVFLLTGVGSLLSVLTNRLGRIIDRARGLEGRLVVATPDEAAPLHGQLSTLSRAPSS